MASWNPRARGSCGGTHVGIFPPPEGTPRFVVRTDCYTPFQGRERLYRIQPFKDVPEWDGGFKIFRYYDGDPELVTGTVWSDSEGA